MLERGMLLFNVAFLHTQIVSLDGQRFCPPRLTQRLPPMGSMESENDCSSEETEKCHCPCHEAGISKEGTAGGTQWLDQGGPAQDLRACCDWGALFIMAAQSCYYTSGQDTGHLLGSLSGTFTLNFLRNREALHLWQLSCKV